ncbi:FAD-dependent monooxygenase [Mesorhizobium sp. L-8-3]|uniref:FAD-dependent monooxygenase n=1 Tax=Mesorhizobium sp. L-8-3 TaxID=2744522 RepID=UPI00192827CC|nr:FAD-dependent monooxygenase [Mesorhizobium sp. L-8-3]BCH25743.1 salicylate hydroxylase [Mesorhizobium sp. L-8-3]
MTGQARRIIVAGAGIAGLTAALAFAARGCFVEIYERAPRLEEAGAGLQLSPNATRILASLGVIDALSPLAVRPEAVVLRDARTLREVTRVPLGGGAERRWGAPYLVAHRADLQGALLARLRSNDNIKLATGAVVSGFASRPDGVTVAVERGGTTEEISGELLVGADGVWSSIRELTGANGKSRFAGDVAWRSTLHAESPAGRAFQSIARSDVVTAFMHRSVHLIAYPVRGGSAVNLVALAKGQAFAKIRPEAADPDGLAAALRGTAPGIARLAQEAGPWTLWPLHTVAPAAQWTAAGRVVLIGDAAHAMTPFAAQGAAMAIEDAATLAAFVAAAPADMGGALARYEAIRRPRIAQVSKRGALNRFTWHASGPVALARNLVLAVLPGAKLAADLDWLYGWTVPEAES